MTRTQTHTGALDFLARQQPRRCAEDVAGRLLYLLRAGLVVVPTNRLNQAWRCITVDGPIPGAWLTVADVEVETALDAATVDPLDGADNDMFATVWLTRVWQRFPAGPVPQAAHGLAGSLPAHGRTVELDPHTVHRLAVQTHLLPAGLRQVLGMLADAGLIDTAWPPEGQHGGCHTLTLPGPARGEELR